jgi:hypothetical protein
MTFLVHVNEHPYAVADEDVGQIESLILDAVHRGGAFVELNDGSVRTERILVTSASTIRISPVPQVVESEDDQGDTFPDFAYLDLEMGLE